MYFKDLLTKVQRTALISSA